MTDQQQTPVVPRRSGLGLLIFTLVVVGMAIFAGRNLLKLTKTEPTPERVDACMRFRDNAARCKEQFVATMLELQASQMREVDERLKKPEARQELIQFGVKQLEQDAAGTPDERRERCVETVKSSPAPKPADIADLDTCFAESDCDRMVACVKPVLQRQMDGQK